VAKSEEQLAATAEEMAALFQQAREDGQKQGYEEGLSNGYQEGYSKGYEEGRQQAGSEIEEELAHIRRVFGNLDDQLHDLDQQVAQNLLTLAIDLAKKMTKEAIAVRPEMILPVVQDAVRQLPGVMRPLRLVLHPDDAGIVRQYLSEQLLQDNGEIFEDTQIAQGGCRIEAGGSEIDASMETRWRRILAAIGQNSDWIEK
jgi:flagellar assembly protein FliH